VLNNPTDKMNALFYFRDDSSSLSGNQESEDKRDKLARLKAEIRGGLSGAIGVTTVPKNPIGGAASIRIIRAIGFSHPTAFERHARA
jgi:hypothetical protein